MKFNITTRIFIGMLLGIILGYVLNLIYVNDPETFEKTGNYLNLYASVSAVLLLKCKSKRRRNVFTSFCHLLRLLS